MKRNDYLMFGAGQQAMGTPLRHRALRRAERDAETLQHFTCGTDGSSTSLPSESVSRTICSLCELSFGAAALLSLQKRTRCTIYSGPDVRAVLRIKKLLPQLDRHGRRTSHQLVQPLMNPATDPPLNQKPSRQATQQPIPTLHILFGMATAEVVGRPLSV